MSKKVARTIPDWGGKASRRRRRVRPHVRRAAGHAFALILVGIPAGLYLLYCLCGMGTGPHVHPLPTTWKAPQDRSPWGDRDSMMRQSATEPHPH
jgi:hypothetical protein